MYALTLRSSLSYLTLSIALAGQAIADAPTNDQRDIEEVIVTGRYLANEKFSATKTPTPLVDVPQSLSIVSNIQIQEQAFTEIGDILRYTPGASIGQGEGHRDQITIRGQNTTADFFIDGLRDDVQYFRPLYNLKQVEVLRGSNALIFGRGGGGGVINRVTKTPEVGEDFGSFTGGVDTFGSVNVAGDGNFAVSDTSAFRVNAFYESLNNHRDNFGGDRFAINPTFATELGEDTRLLLSYEYVDDDRVVDRGVPSLNGEPLRGFDNTFFGGPDFNRTTLQANIARARIDHEFSDALSFNATVQYADYDKLYQNLFPVGFDDQAGTVTLDGYIDRTNRQNLITQVNFVGYFETGGLKHTLLFGGEYGDQDSDNDRRDTFFADSADDRITFNFSDPLVIPAVSFPTFNRDRSSEVSFASLYVQDQIDIGDNFKIVAGLRYDRFDIDVVDNVEVADGATDGNDGLLGRVDEEVSPRIGLIYKPQENVSIYTSYSRSFLPRSGDQFLTLSLTSEALSPEKFENYEIGAKWDINKELSLTASVFRLDRDSGTTVDPNDAGNLILVGSRTEGFELELSGQLQDNWTIHAGYSYLDADERGRVVNGALANRTLSQVPEHMLSLWNRYDFTEKFGIGVGISYQAAQFASISNNVELPDFVRVDTALYYNVSDTVKVQLNVENLFDSDFFTAAHNDNNISTAEPLNARLSFTTKF
ncbi:TonB-dependent receptor [Kordiimonas aquimaris]|uniref:TonB-dependent receptor n=1 Tax=Kordiimonas aquimaris TaxID=707591 RepID=UPI0021D18F80|nr:TonB-dependent siderophore receptor [Kordiimonas aquimaris]